MAKFLTTSGTSHHIEQIIIGAKKTVVFLTPYLFLSRTLLERLQDADRQGIKIIIVYRQNKLRPVEVEVLNNFKSLDIFYSPNLHAKCYFNAKEMIITSMNMYEFSEKNNREMGILINRQEDKELYINAYQEAKSIIAASQRCDSTGQPLATTIPPREVEVKPDFNSGSILEAKAFCIRCHGDISLNVHRPLCSKCYVEWAKFKNRKHPEKYCHQCGLEKQTSLAKPICKKCFIENKK
ncbi:phospholipase D family protein [Picosynechococcus sp. NKBG15041c]|uniref:phospholipase D family protein n=1 Tax=Picosynechococcus sp. NKBG15041c TaxID=1407650 RepID=UPI00040938CD|nr:phospholipase D family protein [Picosynechococcus sp. NKBG15041c]